MVRQNELGVPHGAHTRVKRYGRGDGSGRGNYSGKGRKGQLSRSGAGHMRPGFEGNQLPFVLRIPSKKGFTNIFATHYNIVKLSQLEEYGDAGKTLTPEWMMSMGMIKKPDLMIKILGDGELTKKLTVVANKFSESAKEKIEERGGTATEIALKERRKKGEKA